MNDAESLARNTTAPARSCGTPQRSAGISARYASFSDWGSLSCRSTGIHPDDLGMKPGDVFFPGDVGAEQSARATGGLEISECFFSRGLVVQIIDGNLRAGFAESHGHGAAQTFAAAGNEGDTTCQGKRVLF